jgi:phage I-like protein
VTHLLAKLQNVDANVHALRLEVATFRGEVKTLHGEVNALRADVAKNTADLSTITENLPTNNTALTDTDNAATLSDLACEVARLRRQADEQPVLRRNSCASSKGQLYDPTTYMPSPESLLQKDGSWAEELGPPHPRTRDELMFEFTGE